jgi:hypothetical protein
MGPGVTDPVNDGVGETFVVVADVVVILVGVVDAGDEEVL